MTVLVYVLPNKNTSQLLRARTGMHFFMHTSRRVYTPTLARTHTHTPPTTAGNINDLEGDSRFKELDLSECDGVEGGWVVGGLNGWLGDGVVAVCESSQSGT